MVLKKLNAILGLLSAVAVLFHMGYNSFAYLAFYYNPVLKQWASIPLMVLVCAHAVLGMCSVFLLGDGTSLSTYPAKNRKTLIQRISAALIFPLLILHINTFELLKNSSSERNWALFVLLLIVQIIFYAVITVHTSISISKAFISLGMIENEKNLKLLDRIAWCIFGLAFIITSIAVTKGELLMFIPQ